jgi:hypothetical protein
MFTSLADPVFDRLGGLPLETRKEELTESWHFETGISVTHST